MTAPSKGARAKQQPMAYVEVGYVGYLVPLADGQRLVTILAGAVTATQRYRDRGHVYEVQHPVEPVTASLTVVSPGQIVAVRADGEPVSGPLALSHESLKLKGPAR